MDTNDDNMNESMEETFRANYCKEVTPILTSKAKEHATILKVTEELEFERLKREHAEIDVNISAKLKRIEKTQQETQDLNQRIYNATELKTQVMVRVDRTSQISNVLKDEIEKIKSHAEKIEERRLEFTKKIDKATAKKLKSKELKANLESLEMKIRNMLDAPKPKMNEKLIQENQELKQKLKEKNEILAMKRRRKNQIQNVKNEKEKLQQKIYEKQNENREFRDKIEKEKVALKDKERNMQEKLDEMQERLKKNIENKNNLLGDLKRSAKHTEEMLTKIEEKKENVLKKETELRNLKEKIEIKQSHIEEENKRKKVECESEVKKLMIIEDKLKESIKENEEYLKAIADKTAHLANLKDRKTELIVQLYDNKMKLVIQQQQNTEQQNKIDVISEKMKFETQHVNDMKEKNEELDKVLQDLSNQLNQLPREIDERRQEIRADHQKKVNEMLKQHNVHKAEAELLELQLDENAKKIETLEKEVKEFEIGIKWEEMKHDMNKKRVEQLEDKVARKEQAAMEELTAERKQKEDELSQQSHKSTTSERKESAAGLWKIKSPAKIKKPAEETESGRKSPGILKSQFKNPRSPVKRVTFQGLSSSESSSISIKSPEQTTNNSQVENESLDELLKDWEVGAYGRKRKIDF